MGNTNTLMSRIKRAEPKWECVPTIHSVRVLGGLSGGRFSVSKEISDFFVISPLLELQIFDLFLRHFLTYFYVSF